MTDTLARRLEDDSEETALPALPAPVPAVATEPEPVPAVPAAQPVFVPMPWWRAAIYAVCSVVLGLTQGLGINLVTANLTNLGGSLQATQLEVSWLAAAYYATNLTATLLLFKVRTQFGLRRFAEIGIVIYIAVIISHLFTNELHSALVVRAITGIASAPLSTLAFYYMLEWLPPAKKMTVGICFGLLGSNLATPLARVISPELLQIGDWHGLYLAEAGLAIICFAIVYLLPLTHPPRMKIFDKDDIISFPLLAVGFGAMSIVLSMGKTYWWLEAPWLGALLAVGIVAFTLLLLVEMHRKNPIINLTWLTSGDMVVFAGSLLVFRLLLSEQSVGAVGMFTALGMQNEQMVMLFAVIGVITFAATYWLSTILTPQRTPAIHMFALALIAVASWMDSHSTVLTRPEQFYLSQALLGFASAIFLPPALLNGFGKALAKGPQYILSFFTVFIATQTLGGMVGSAVLGTFVTLREQFHSNVMAQGITLLDPIVAQRVQAYGGAYSKVMTDPALTSARGMTLLSQAATQQANVLAYNDLFLVIFIATLLTMAGLGIHILFTQLNKRRALNAQPA